MEQLPKIVQRGLQATQKSGVHPDPDLLAAFAEKSLTGGERIHVLQHLAECADCRQVVSLAAPAIETAPLPRPERSLRLSWPVLRWGALAACVLVVGAAVTLHYESPVRAPLEERASAPSAGVAAVDKSPDRPAEKLAAKIAPQAPVQFDRDFATAAGQLSKQNEKAMGAGTATARTGVPAPQRFDQNRQEFSNREPSNDRPADSVAAKSTNQAASSPPPAVRAPMPATPSASPELQAEAHTDATEHTPRVMNETVVIQGVNNSVQVLPPAAEPKMKDESLKKVQAARVAAAAGAVTVQQQKTDAVSAEAAQTASDDYTKQSGAGRAVTRWTLSADGELRRSFDSGKNWQTIPVAGNVVFRALSANGSDIWAGGAAGVLYHSSDAGQHWTQVKPADNGKPLTADIVGVEFSDTQHGKLTTSDHEVWTTIDAGITWQSH